MSAMLSFVQDKLLVIEAVKAGREDKVQALLDSGCQQDAVDADGRTALHWACQYGHLTITCRLLSTAAMAVCSTCGGRWNLNAHSALHVNSISNVHLQASRPAVTNKATLVTVSRRGDSQSSARGRKPMSPGGREADQQTDIPGKCSCLKTRDWQLRDVINRRDAKGQTPLHVACNFRREDVAAFLATLPLCDLDARDEQGHTPLHRAVHANLETLAALLCDLGADVHARNALLWTPLHEAVRTGNENVVRMLVNRGCDLNAVTHNGMTPFLTAVFYYRIAQRATYKTLDGVLRHLIEAGCRLSQGDSQWTPLSASIAIDNSIIASLLLYNGCRFERCCPTYSRSMLVEAFSRCEPLVARLMVECGYQPNNEEMELCSRRIPAFSPIFLLLPVAHAQTSLKEKYQLLQWLRQRAHNACSLMELSRTAIRLALNHAADDASILRRMAQLPLPSALLDFILLQKFTDDLTMS